MRWILFFSKCPKKWTLQECVEYAMKNNLKVIQNQYNKQNQDKNLSMAKIPLCLRWEGLYPIMPTLDRT